jgi:ferredoxin
MKSVYVIAEPCIGCKDKACVAVCPMDCIHEGVVEKDGTVYDQLFIDPEECIFCGMCEPECPVDAIFADDELPSPWRHFTEINAEFYRPGRRTLQTKV